ncbi:MAG: hypothetical protein ACI9XU_001902 [Arenicella sp.]|jgi:hypothetical protein
MQARVCVQNSNDNDVQGFLYINDGTGESLVTTDVFEADSDQAGAFVISATRGRIKVTANVNVGSNVVNFVVVFNGDTSSPSMFSTGLAVSATACTDYYL